MSLKKRTSERKTREAVNETILWLNRSPLGCRVERVKSDRFFDAIDRKERRILAKYPNIHGTAKDGRAIWIERIAGPHNLPPRKAKRTFMEEEEARGAIVGCAYDYGDAWDIISGLKRKKRTYQFKKEYIDGKKQGNGAHKECTDEDGSDENSRDGSDKTDGGTPAGRGGGE